MQNLLRNFICILMILLLSNILVSCASDTIRYEDRAEANQSVSHSERIIFENDWTIFSVNPDGSDNRVVDNGPADFRVSPDGRWMLIITLDLTVNNQVEEKGELRLYDFKDASFIRINMPEGNWMRQECWWSDNSDSFHMFSFVKDEQLRYEPLRSNKLKIDKILTYDLSTREFIIRRYKKRSGVVDFFVQRGPIARTRCDFVSPDGRHVLKWDVPDDIETYGQQCGRECYEGDCLAITLGAYYDIILLSKNNLTRKLVFKNNKGDKFGSSVYPITEFPWSPDSSQFVLEKFLGGIWRIMFTADSSKRSAIYVIDRETLKWNFIAYGSTPYWFPKLPLSFTEQPSLPVKTKIIDVDKTPKGSSLLLTHARDIGNALP